MTISQAIYIVGSNFLKITSLIVLGMICQNQIIFQMHKKAIYFAVWLSPNHLSIFHSTFCLSRSYYCAFVMLPFSIHYAALYARDSYPNRCRCILIINCYSSGTMRQIKSNSNDNSMVPEVEAKKWKTVGNGNQNGTSAFFMGSLALSPSFNIMPRNCIDCVI